MKELSIEEKAKRYDEAFEKLRRLHDDYDNISALIDIKEELEQILSELKESDDDRIRKEIISYVKSSGAVSNKTCIAWLEKQGEQTFVDKAEPKFKVGDWVVFNNKHQSIYQVEKIENGYYILRHTHGGTFRVCVLHDESLRLWTIQDANDGDVLASKDGDDILIFRNIEDNVSFSSYYNIARKVEHYWSKGRFFPATKEQRDLLFQKMKEAGYEWNSEKKILIGFTRTTKSNNENASSTWSDEDSNRFRNLIYLVERSNEGMGTKRGFIDFINRLKSFKDRVKPQWKPSEEQLNALDEVYKTHGANSVCRRIIFKLLEQLKKL